MRAAALCKELPARAHTRAPPGGSASEGRASLGTGRAAAALAPHLPGRGHPPPPERRRASGRGGHAPALPRQRARPRSCGSGARPARQPDRSHGLQRGAAANHPPNPACPAPLPPAAAPLRPGRGRARRGGAGSPARTGAHPPAPQTQTDRQTHAHTDTRGRAHTHAAPGAHTRRRVPSGRAGRCRRGRPGAACNMALVPCQVLHAAILLSYCSILCNYKAIDMPAHQTYGGSWKFLTFIDLVSAAGARGPAPSLRLPVERPRPRAGAPGGGGSARRQRHEVTLKRGRRRVVAPGPAVRGGSRTLRQGAGWFERRKTRTKPRGCCVLAAAGKVRLTLCLHCADAVFHLLNG